MIGEQPPELSILPQVRVDGDVEVVLDVEHAGANRRRNKTKNQQSGDRGVGERHGSVSYGCGGWDGC